MNRPSLATTRVYRLQAFQGALDLIPNKPKASVGMLWKPLKPIEPLRPFYYLAVGQHVGYRYTDGG